MSLRVMVTEIMFQDGWIARYEVVEVVRKGPLPKTLLLLHRASVVVVVCEKGEGRN